MLVIARVSIVGDIYSGEFNLSNFEDGVLSSAFMVGLLVASPIFASLAKRRERHGMLVFKLFNLVNYVACRGSVYRALGLMVAASPCALAVAPLAYATAISSCARKGILLKGGHALDALASCHTIAFDKTGTLTTGGLVFKAIEPIYGHQARKNRSDFASCCVPSC